MTNPGLSQFKNHFYITLELVRNSVKNYNCKVKWPYSINWELFVVWKWYKSLNMRQGFIEVWAIPQVF